MQCLGAGDKMTNEKCKYCGNKKLALGLMKGLYCQKCGRPQYELEKDDKEVIRTFFGGKLRGLK
jgi:tRNA(Ile2) C34 agmatinyltransferase TiaS